MILIGEARISENGTYWGKAGDQTGNEVCFREYNAPENWEYVFRPISDDVANRLANAMLQACINPNVGYSQSRSGDIYSQRYGVYTAMCETGCILAIEKPVNCDCSALVASCCTIAGVPVPVEMVTAYEAECLEYTKAFMKIPYTPDMKLMAGDILLRNGHTAICIESDYPRRGALYVAQSIGYTYVYKDETMKKLLPEWALLGEGNLVDVYAEVGDALYIRIAGKYYGYCKKTDLKRV